MKGKTITLSSSCRDKLNSFSLPKNLGFGQIMAPIMAQSIYSNNSWSPLEIKPYAPINIDPASKFIHYGQQIFEGLKSTNE